MKNNPNRAFTVTYKRLANVLNVEVGISANTDKKISDSKKWLSLWDTGATCSVITKNVVEKLGLKPVSMAKARTPQGEYEAYQYYIDLLLPNQVEFKGLLVMEGQPAGCDILIGMDVIGKGDFAVSNYNGVTKFTYRHPSTGEMDFVQNTYYKPIVKKTDDEAPPKNSKCPCGSGKKYKQCCGKI